MNVSHGKTKVALAVLMLAASAGASAIPMTLTGITGDYLVWGTPPVLTSTPNAGIPSVQAVLDDGSRNAAGPGGNVELNKFGGYITPSTPNPNPVTTMTGNFNGKPITLRSLQESDWLSGLDKRYIQAAASSALLGTLSNTEMTLALTRFYTPNAKLGGFRPWQLVSDPNISYVDMAADHTVHIGLAGFLNASLFLSDVFGVTLQDGLGASEVVAVNLDGLTDYLFGFSPTNSGVYASGSDFKIINGVNTPVEFQYRSYSGNYDVVIPEPASLALLGIGLVGLFLGRRRRV